MRYRTKKTPPNTIPGRQAHGAAADFVRSVPLDVPAADVIKLAADRGLHVSKANVWATRNTMRRPGQRPPPAPTGTTATPTPPRPTRTRRMSPYARGPELDLEVELRRLAVRIGYERARAVVESLLDLPDAAA